MKRTLIIILLIACIYPLGYSTSLIDHKEVDYFDAEKIRSTWKSINIPQLYLPVNNGVYVYEITFTTTWIDGSHIRSTGLVLIPDNLHKDYSTIIYHNGTNIMRRREQTLGYNQFSICTGLAADGYVVVIPDYIGRGGGEKQQLYLDAQSEGQNSVDMLLATSGLMEMKNFDPIHDLYITGYSQGGHSAMSTHRLIEKKYMDKFELVASSPMSGPYDLLGSVQVDPKNKEGDWVLFMFLVKSYQDAYQIRPSMSDIFIAPFDSLVNVYFDGINKYGEIRGHLPKDITQIFKEEFLITEFLSGDSDFKNKLKDNSIYDFKPTVPTQLCYCSDDETVPGKNSVTAYNWMKKNGTKKLKIKDAGKNLDHEECAIFTVIYTKLFFDKYRDVKHSNFRNDFSNVALRMASAAKKLFPRIKLF